MGPALLDALLGQILLAAPEAADILLVPGRRAQASVNGTLHDLILSPDPGPLAPHHTNRVAAALLAGRAMPTGRLAATGACDLALTHSSGARLRVNVFRRQGSLGVVMRRLPQALPTLESLGLPEIFADMAVAQDGLALVTGATGSGKTTSLAAVTARINATRPVHVVTLEDPVEYVHPAGAAVISQRELGADFPDFATGLRAALRQAPRVILVGEVRDRETMETALAAAETGHLVLGTLHTADAGRTIARIVSLFDPAEERLVRQRLAGSLRFCVTQRLLPAVGGGRVAAFEVMRSSLRTRELMLTGETPERTFRGVLADGAASGMWTFDQFLAGLYQSGRVDEATALRAAADQAAMTRLLDRMKAERGGPRSRPASRLGPKGGGPSLELEE